MDQEKRGFLWCTFSWMHADTDTHTHNRAKVKGKQKIEMVKQIFPILNLFGHNFFNDNREYIWIEERSIQYNFVVFSSR